MRFYEHLPVSTSHLFHCEAGKNRVPTLAPAVALALLLSLGVRGQDVEDVIVVQSAAVVAAVDDQTASEAAAKDGDQPAPAKAKKVAEAKPDPAEGRPVGRAIQAVIGRFRFRPAGPSAAQNEPGVGELASDEELDKFEAQLEDEAKTLLRQFKPQVDHMCREELRFVHLVCDLTKSQFTAIETEARLASRKSLLETIQVQFGLRRGINARNLPRFPDPQLALEDALLSAVRRELSEKQLADYRDELEARRLFRRDAGIEVIVASLDRALLMSPQQRDSVVDALRLAWKDDWQRNVEMLANGNQYLPKLPNSLIRKVLIDEQKIIFQSLRQDSNFFFAGNPLGHFGQVAAHGSPTPLVDELEFAPEKETR